MGIDKDYQRFGIARKMYDKFEELMKEDGVKILIVDTQADNLPALRFFEKIGFRNPQHCVYMLHRLKEDEMPVVEDISKTKKQKVDVNIRKMVLSDVSKVYHLGEKIFTASKSQSHYRAWDEYAVVEFFNNDEEICLVAELKDKVVGFCLGMTIAKGGQEGIQGYVTWLGVKEPLRRRGIGSLLFTEIRKRMQSQGARVLLVDTELSNTPAINFFKKHGFEQPTKHIFLDYNLSERGEKPKELRRSTRNKKNSQ